MVKRALGLAGLFLAVTYALACSSSESAPAPAADGGTPQDAPTSSDSASPTDSSATDSATAPTAIAWKDDGTQNGTDGTAEALVGGGIIGFALNVGDATHGNALSLNIVAASPAEWKPGTYPCPSPASVGYVHSPNGGVTYKQATCSVTVTEVGAIGGAHLKGTFEATLDISSGGKKTLSNGTFDVPYKMP